ncbi:MAG TPA: 50S ribosomal protein L9 [Salinivirgaceae bacterium]|nr:50S ribosomal protein L9 [Salinivirgaceae bacterium]
MEVILKQDIPTLGNKNDIVTVKPGYGRNYLIPKGLAILATPSSIKMMEEMKRQQAHKEAKLREAAQELAKQIAAIEKITIGAKTSTSGKIFGSVNTIQLAEALNKKGFNIDRKSIIIDGDSIKEVGSYSAKIKLYRDVVVTVNFDVVSE